MLLGVRFGGKYHTTSYTPMENQIFLIWYPVLFLFPVVQCVNYNTEGSLSSSQKKIRTHLLIASTTCLGLVEICTCKVLHEHRHVSRGGIVFLSASLCSVRAVVAGEPRTRKCHQVHWCIIHCYFCPSMESTVPFLATAIKTEVVGYSLAAVAWHPAL